MVYERQYQYVQHFLQLNDKEDEDIKANVDV